MSAHIVAGPDDKKTLCGELSYELSVTLARWVQMHIDGRDPEWCEQCLALWKP